MRLTDLNPRWIWPTMQWASDDPYYVGVRFDSPLGTGQKLAVHFKNPIDPKGLAVKYGWCEMNPGTLKWERIGDTFENLTLNPSLDFSAHGEWHGLIQNGEVIAK